MYDIYKLSTEVEEIATKSTGTSREIIEILNNLEIPLNNVLSGSIDSLNEFCSNTTNGYIKLNSICADLLNI